MANYSQHVSKKTTAQTDKAKDGQKKNNAGGFSFVLDKWAILDRFLILGAEGNTYYCTEKKMVKDNTKNLEACLNEDGVRTVNRIVEISEAGRAPKNDPAIFALAVAAAHPNQETRKAALAALPRVCRIGTHLFHFARDVNEFRGWGRTLRTAIGAWYLDKKPEDVAYQAVKYQQRDGWSHKDLFRKAHPVASSPEQDSVFRYILSGTDGMSDREVKAGGNQKNARKYGAVAEKLPRIIEGFELAKHEKDPKKIASLIQEYRLTHEMIPTESKNDVGVWQALLENMPMTAMIRSLGKMTAVGALKPLSPEVKKVLEMLTDQSAIQKARVHPIAVLSALKVYGQGHGEKGKLSWQPVPAIVSAVDQAFYLAFKNIEPTGKNIFLAIDISGSMDGGEIAGVPGLTPREAAGAMAMATIKAEKNWHCMGFTTGTSRANRFGGANQLTPINIDPSMSLQDVIKEMQRLAQFMGGTDCSMPMEYAQANKLEVDAFQVYTDNETYAGRVHPFQALKSYRAASGRNAKEIVIGMTSTEFTIADPSDPGMLDVVGFDTAAPAIMADFIRDRPVVEKQ